MLKDTPYSTLKQDERGYDILLLRDQSGNTFAGIARAYGISAARATQVYYRLKYRQISLYANHLALVFGHSSTAQIRKICEVAYECYQDFSYVTAYLEQTYPDILAAYRNGEPGMPAEFLEKLPPLRVELTEQEIRRIVAMRETKKATFAKIAKELGLTPERANRAYEMFYHRKVLKLVEALQARAKTEPEKNEIWETCFRNYRTAKARYELLTKRLALAEAGETEIPVP